MKQDKKEPGIEARKPEAKKTEAEKSEASKTAEKKEPQKEEIKQDKKEPDGVVKKPETEKQEPNKTDEKKEPKKEEKSAEKPKSNDHKFLPDLKLALAWNRFECAKKYFFSAEAREKNIKFEDKDLQKVMSYAIENDRVDFIKVFLHGELNLKKFLTRTKLAELYTSVLSKCFSCL